MVNAAVSKLWNVCIRQRILGSIVKRHIRVGLRLIQCLLEGRLIEAGFPIATVTSCMHRRDSTDHRPMYRQRLTEHLRPCETFRSWPAGLIWIWLVSHSCCNQSKCFCDFIVCVTFVGTCAWLVWLQVVRKGCVMCGRLSSLKLDSDIEKEYNLSIVWKLERGEVQIRK